MDFDRFAVVLLIRGADAGELDEEAEAALQDAHLAHLAGLHEAGHLVAAGPLRDPDARLRGLSIFRTDPEQARALSEADPAVRAGWFSVQVLPWLAPGGAIAYARTRFPRSAADAAGD